MIDVSGLTKTFGSLTAVDNLNLCIEKGEVFGFLGPNGAGKTTTIRMLACLIAPSKGTASIAGYDIYRDPQKVRQSVGILTENPSLYERLTAYENLDFFAQAYGVTNPQERQSRIRELLEFFNLWERRNDKAGTFSKGMKQKLAIVRATVHQPPVLFLDEPTAGLDPKSAKEIRDLMEQLSRHENRTILLCTHHLEDAEKLCKRVLIMNKGHCILIGTPDELRYRINPNPTIQISLRELNPKITSAVENNKHTQTLSTNQLNAELLVSVKDARLATPEIVRSVVEAEGQILSVNVVRPSLEDAYLNLIKEQTSQ
ncbi:ABC transporter ATP-binding protein [Candidatus Bathycorpusculum sp.]|uniref:ABC transporter ATP-binding protein n=1 Tax=Candidatus Bathycorpusculum sp. TaxID=2994959 RepID=UPI00282962D2|nr:ABC transporter ATP-binding protein [Candidatus Termitimicrobium sp.]MCL2686504.1 ABC transporter ATP-binding protein [Candidatus Termitimicrobium sp.]